MEIIRALKMRIYPNDEQKVKINKTLGTCRFVYNHMLARNQKVYERRGSICPITRCRIFFLL